MVRALGGEPETLDPRLAADNPSLTLMHELYEGLTREAADGTVVPGAAESWHVSDDGTVWTFELGPDYSGPTGSRSRRCTRPGHRRGQGHGIRSAVRSAAGIRSPATLARRWLAVSDASCSAHRTYNTRADVWSDAWLG